MRNNKLTKKITFKGCYITTEISIIFGEERTDWGTVTAFDINY